MAARDVDSQRDHDETINAVRGARFRDTDCEHFVNPDDEKNLGIAYVDAHCHNAVAYPDIVSIRKRDGAIARVAEIETLDSVTREESKQWVLYARLTDAFYLYVPLSSLRAALKLRPHGARLRGYTYDAYGHIVIFDK